MFLHEVLLRAVSETDNDKDHDVGVGTTIDTSDCTFSVGAVYLPLYPSTVSPDTLFTPKSTLSRQSRLALLLLMVLNDMEVANSHYRADIAAKRYAAAALLAVAIYNAIEMMPIIYFTFSRFSGLYFWSMVTAVTGVMMNAIGFGM